jgi:acyl carrier protein
MTSPVMARVAQLAADIFSIPVERIEPQSSPDNIENWDSIQHLNLVLALEQEFEVQFTPEEIEQLLSIDLVASLLEEKQKACGVY